jgi:GNAT superfamily N-acetyltransferase
MITIRNASPADVPVIYDMLRRSAEDQGFPDDLVATPENLMEDGFGPDPRFLLLVAEVDGEPAGLALYFFNYSTWVSRVGLYLEDLYVVPEHRRAGVARALMSRLASIAVNHGCRRFLWAVHSANERAIAFYEDIGARPLRDWILMALKHGALEAAGREAPSPD